MSEVHARISGPLTQVQVLGGRLHALDDGKRSFGPEIGREVLGEIGGAFAEEIFGTSGAGDLGYSLTKRLVAQRQRQENAAERTRIEYELKQVLEKGIALLSEVSVDKPSLKPPGNSHQLVGRLKRIAGMASLGTRLTRTVQFFQSLQTEKLIHNKDIPQAIFARHPRDQEAYLLLKELEGGLRILIQDELSEVSQNWWVERVPEDVRKNAEDRKARDDRPWPWHTGDDQHPLYYVDFPDYLKIITRRDNWREVFSKIFHDQVLISAKLRELEPIRNTIAHTRPLDRHSFEKLKVNARDIMSLLGKQLV